MPPIIYVLIHINLISIKFIYDYDICILETLFFYFLGPE